MRRNSQSDGLPTAVVTDSHDPHRFRTVHDAGSTKERIQRVALELFVLHGYEKTSLREIADRLGITKAALYYHYASKQELLKSISQPWIDELEALVADDPDPETLLRSYIDVLYRHWEVFKLAFTDHASLVAAELVERTVQLRRAVVRQLAGPDAGPADYLLASAAFGAIGQGFVVAQHHDPAADPALFAPEVAAEAAAGMPAPADYPEGEDLTELLLGAAFRVLGSRHLTGVVPGTPGTADTASTAVTAGTSSGGSAEKP